MHSPQPTTSLRPMLKTRGSGSAMTGSTSPPHKNIQPHQKREQPYAQPQIQSPTIA